MARRRQTKQLILNEIAGEMLNKALEDIDLGTVLKRIGIPTTTFYYHFHSLANVAETMMQMFVEQIEKNTEEHPYYANCKDMKDMWEKKKTQDINLFSAFYENRKIFSALMNGEYRDRFSETLFRAFLKREERLEPSYIDNDGVISDPEEKEKQYILRASADLDLCLIRIWNDRRFQETPEEFYRIVYNIYGKDKRLIYKAYFYEPTKM